MVTFVEFSEIFSLYISILEGSIASFLHLYFRLIFLTFFLLKLFRQKIFLLQSPRSLKKVKITNFGNLQRTKNVTFQIRLFAYFDMKLSLLN